MKVGMIGLGGMGKPVAECILREGFNLTVADLRQGQVEALVTAGAQSAKTPAEIAAVADIVISFYENTYQFDIFYLISGHLFTNNFILKSIF